MHEQTLKTIYTWLKQANYDVNLPDLQKRFLSHPDVGTLSSITDTLNDFNIANQALQIEASSIHQLTEPFIAFVQKEQSEQFVLVSPTGNNNYVIYTGNNKAFTLSLKYFSTLFSGIIIAIDKKDKTILDYKKELRFFINIVFVVSVCSLLLTQTTFELHTAAFSLLTFSGCVFSALLYAHSIGVQNNFLNRFCTISKQSNCNTVLQSDAAKINKHISLTDVGLVYFSFQLLSILFLNHGSILIHAISIPVAAFSLYSIYQQAFVIKKWCPLCLGVVGVLILQGIIATLTINLSSIRLIESISLFFLFLLTCIGWYYFKRYFTNKSKLIQTETDLLSFKRNYHLLLPFYKHENPVNDSALVTQTQIIIGNVTATVCITLITNPLCIACKHAHKVLTEIYSQYPADIAIRLVFYVPYQNPNDPRTMIADWLVDEYLNDREQGINAIEKWYNNPDVKVFDALRLPTDKIRKKKGFLQAHAEWCVQQRLTLTPLLLINNKLFPLIYRTEDVRFHIEAVLEYEKDRLVESEKSLPSTKVLVDNT